VVIPTSVELRATKQTTSDKCDPDPSPSARLQSAPKGLLRFYILHRIAQGPVHGYEVIQDIDSKTEGAWRPGAGSLYPLLKKLESEGLARAEEGSKEEATRRVYHITQKGLQSLSESKEMLANFQQRWSFMRKIFIELIDPERVANFFVDSSNHQLQLAREILESKSGKMSKADVEYMLKEYALSLERQLSWANERMREMKPKIITSSARLKGVASQ
jgi:DNA-binding PadR family transcriptional regulator